MSIQDWFVVEKNVLHVKCFKCDTCHLQLRKTNYQVYTEPTTGKISFHCRYHNLNKQQTKVQRGVIEFFFSFLFIFFTISHSLSLQDENETTNKQSPLGKCFRSIDREVFIFVVDDEVIFSNNLKRIVSYHDEIVCPREDRG